ncbi:MAG: hypothetical protein EA340_15720 [Nitriliruptor sp.]|nr:MAG: hypothetical protein EA340_15720 [Nitriliruptor sp.]
MSCSRGRGRAQSVRAAIVAAAAIWLLATMLAEPGLAQSEVPEPRAEVTVTALTRVLGPGTIPALDDPARDLSYPEDLELRVLVDNVGSAPLTGAQLVVEVHPPTLTRGLLAAALEGDLTGPALHVHTQPLSDEGPVQPGELIGLTDRFARQEVIWAGGTGGVHPVRIAVLLGTEVLDEVVTAVVWLNDVPTTPLLASLIWPIDTPPWRGPGGSYPSGVERETRPGSRLDRLVGAVERAPANVPVVLAPAAHLLEDLSDRSDGYVSQVRTEAGNLEPRRVGPSDAGAIDATALLRRIRDIAGLSPLTPISSSYADADLAALLAGDAVHGELAAIAAADGRRRLQRQLGVEVDGATHLIGAPLDSAVLDVVPGETLLLPSHVTDLPALGNDPELGPPVRPLRAPSGRMLTGLVGDPYLAAGLDQLGSGTGAIVASQRVLAETAMAYLTSPGSGPRGLVLLPEQVWDPPGAVADELLEALGGAPWLRFVSPATVTAQAQRSSSVLGLAPPASGALDAELGPELSAVWTDLHAAVDASPPETTRLEGRPIEQLRDDLLRATSAWFRGDGTAQAAALVRDVRRVVDATFGVVEVAAQPVTLTSDTGQVPVTLERTRGGPLQVVVTVESQGRLLWPEGRRSELIELSEGTAQTVSFATQAVSTGTFPVTVVVTDPAENRELARDALSVRSTAISRPALAAVGILVLVLLLVGSLRRRPERPTLEVVRDTDGAPPDRDVGGGGTR